MKETDIESDPQKLKLIYEAIKDNSAVLLGGNIKDPGHSIGKLSFNSNFQSFKNKKIDENYLRLKVKQSKFYAKSIDHKLRKKKVTPS